MVNILLRRIDIPDTFSMEANILYIPAALGEEEINTQLPLVFDP